MSDAECELDKNFNSLCSSLRATLFRSNKWKISLCVPFHVWIRQKGTISSCKDSRPIESSKEITIFFSLTRNENANYEVFLEIFWGKPSEEFRESSQGKTLKLFNCWNWVDVLGIRAKLVSSRESRLEKLQSANRLSMVISSCEWKYLRCGNSSLFFLCDQGHACFQCLQHRLLSCRSNRKQNFLSSFAESSAVNTKIL